MHLTLLEQNHIEASTAARMAKEHVGALKAAVGARKRLRVSTLQPLQSHGGVAQQTNAEELRCSSSMARVWTCSSRWGLSDALPEGRRHVWRGHGASSRVACG